MSDIVDLTAMVRLMSSDSQIFEVEEAVAKQSITLKCTIEGEYQSINQGLQMTNDEYY